MTRILSHIDVHNPDWCHSVGQTLLRPASILFGRSYQVDDYGFHLSPNPNASLAKRVVIAALAILLFPVTLAAAGMGALLLARSVTHKRAYREGVEWGISVWQRMSQVSSRHLTFRPIEARDLPVYERVFKSLAAKRQDVGDSEDITNCFHQLLDRWKEHRFSALAVELNQTGQVIGYAIVGHGDYEGNLNKGFAGISGVGDPTLVNTDCRDGAASGIETAEWRDLELEAIRVCMAYARALKWHGDPVPCDVAPEQGPEIETAVRQNPALRVHRNGDGDIDGIYLPFAGVRATARRGDETLHRLLQQVFVEENGGTKVPHPTDADSDLFAVNL